MSKRYRPTVAEIHLDNIIHNYKTIKQTVNNKSIIPVIKADAYGHGAIQIASTLYNMGVRTFAVSLIEEAIELRDKFKEIDILIFGQVSIEDLSVLSENNITFTISDETIFSAVLSSNINLKFHINIDTGMNRLGLKSLTKIIHFMNKMKGNDNLKLEGIYTHLATADSDEDYAMLQIQRFKSIIQALPYKPTMIHLSNSSSTINYENHIDFTTHVRVGIMLYGLSLEENVTFLKPAMVFKTKINYIKVLKKHEFVSYNITYQAQKDETIAILPVGYADGFIRKNQGGYVSINNKKYEIIGRVCMDLTMIRIDDAISMQDDVILMGDDIVTIDDVAKRLDTINYEIVCLVSRRVPRIYV
ncbi:MAG: alanine racemase [Bacillota bacterium]